MPQLDLPLAELESFDVGEAPPDDLGEFWEATLDRSRAAGCPPQFETVASRLSTVEVVDVTFAGFGGQPVKAWLRLPRHRDGPLPAIVEYVGYTGGRGLPHERLLWSASGYAHVVVDARGQRGADTPDMIDGPLPPQEGGVLTRGIGAAETFYYRRLMTDAVLAVDAAAAHPAIDENRVGVAGISQGGGLALAVAGLHDGVTALACDVPFLCAYRRAVGVTGRDPYGELARYFEARPGSVEASFATLRYFDGVHLASRASAPSLFSVGLCDDITPPSTVFAAYNRYRGPKRIEVYPYNHHDGGGEVHNGVKLDFFAEHLGPG